MERVNPSISDLTSQIDFKTSPTSLGLQSNYTDERIRQATDKIAAQSAAFAEYINADQYPLDEKGNRIVNYDENKQWFFNNINFVFGIGRRFVEEDEKNLDNVLRCFNARPGMSYLGNTHYVLTYKYESIKGLENWKRTIQDGYYHIILGIINSASEEDIPKAPVATMRKGGVLSVLTTWDEISNYMAWAVSTFGFITDQTVETKAVNYDKMQHLPRENMYNTGEFNSVMSMRMEDFPKNEEYFKFQTNKKLRNSNSFVTTNRGPDHDTVDLRFRNKNDLYSRIRNTKNDVEPRTRIKGVISKSELYTIPKDKQTAETAIYGMQYYDVENGVNLYETTDPMAKALPPTFSSTQPVAKGKDATGKASRTTKAPISVFPK